MAPTSELQPECGYPFEYTTDNTFLTLYLTDWILSAVLIGSMLCLIADADCSIISDTIPGHLFRGASQGTEIARGKLRYRIAVGVTVFLALFWAAQAFIVRGADACAEKGLVGQSKWAPWLLFGLQGALVLACIGAVVFLNRAWHKEERKKTKGKGKGRAGDQGSSGLMTPRAPGDLEEGLGISSLGEDGIELQTLQESRQTENQAPVRNIQGSQTNEQGPGPSTKTTREPEPGPETQTNNNRASQESARAAYARTVSERTTRHMTLAIRRGAIHPANDNGEGSSKDAHLFARSEPQTDVQEYPFPIMPRTRKGNWVGPSTPTSPRHDSGVEVDEEASWTFKRYFRRLMETPERTPDQISYQHAELGIAKSV